MTSQDDPRPWDGGWRWRLKLGLIVGSSVIACGLIVFGAVRFLDQAQREHDRVECIRVQVQTQARGTATMAAFVLDMRHSQPERQQAFRKWADEQSHSADLIEEC